MADEQIHQQIDALAEEQKRLRAEGAPQHQQRLSEIEVELDRLWDLVRQRDARREFGQDPDEAVERSADTVEHYRN